ncbi:MAG: hypothetical protein IKW77_10740 [Salinivirgaceae bacterium]|nr:hypothetical protein [Salinivirgaceae bacterium]
MKTIKFIGLMATIAAMTALFNSCDLQSLLDEANEDDSEGYSYTFDNEYGGKSTYYSSASWATLADKAAFINKFESIGGKLSESVVSNGVYEGDKVEEVRFNHAATDDEAAAYVKKMAANGYIFSYDDGMLTGYKVESDGVRYEFILDGNDYCYRKTVISSLKKEEALKDYAEELKGASRIKVYTNWTQTKTTSPWIQVFPEVGGIYKVATTDVAGNIVTIYGVKYDDLAKLAAKAVAEGFTDDGWSYSDSFEKEINGNRYTMSIDYGGWVTFQRYLKEGSDGSGDYVDRPSSSENQENNNEQNQEAPVDNGNPGENENENNNGGNGQAVSADDFNADGDIDWRDKFYKLVATSGVSTHTRKTYNGEVSLYNFTSVYGAIQVYDSAAGYEPNQYYYDLSVKGGLMYEYSNGAWRYKSRIYKDRNKPVDEGFKSQFSTLVYFAPPSWGVADIYLGTSVLTKVGSVTYAGRECTEYTYNNNYRYYIDNETDICLYYNGAGVEFETLDFKVGAKLSVPNYRRYQADFPTNVKITTTETAFGMTSNLTIIKIGNEWMSTDKYGTRQYWKFDNNGITLKAMVKDDGDENWTSVLDSTHWQDFDYFAQKCDFSFIFSNSTPKGTCYSECNPTSETLTVCGFECVKYDGTSVMSTSYEFYVNESNNVVYKAKDISTSEITGWDTSVSSFDTSAPQ